MPRILTAAIVIVTIAAVAWGVGCVRQAGATPPASAAGAAPAVPAAVPDHQLQEDPPVGDKLTLTDDQWRARLSLEQYNVLRRHGTEPAFCGGYTAIKHNGPGIYHCAGCGAPLFSAEAKFESGTGWPSFFQQLPGRVETESDTSHGMVRSEIHCARCGGHLGHVFDDGPRPTGLRYCINAVALAFTPAGGIAPSPAQDAKPGAGTTAAAADKADTGAQP
jgi:peptide-methionine (R)-S-oxide reductase